MLLSIPCFFTYVFENFPRHIKAYLILLNGYVAFHNTNMPYLLNWDPVIEPFDHSQIFAVKAATVPIYTCLCVLAGECQFPSPPLVLNYQTLNFANLLHGKWCQAVVLVFFFSSKFLEDYSKNLISLSFFLKILFTYF